MAITKDGIAVRHEDKTAYRMGYVEGVNVSDGLVWDGTKWVSTGSTGAPGLKHYDLDPGSLVWTASGHTATANTIASFDGAGATFTSGVTISATDDVGAVNNLEVLSHIYLGASLGSSFLRSDGAGNVDLAGGTTLDLVGVGATTLTSTGSFLNVTSVSTLTLKSTGAASHLASDAADVYLDTALNFNVVVRENGIPWTTFDSSAKTVLVVGDVVVSSGNRVGFGSTANTFIDGLDGGLLAVVSSGAVTVDSASLALVDGDTAAQINSGIGANQASVKVSGGTQVEIITATNGNIKFLETSTVRGLYDGLTTGDWTFTPAGAFVVDATTNIALDAGTGYDVLVREAGTTWATFDSSLKELQVTGDVVISSGNQLRFGGTTTYIDGVNGLGGALAVQAGGNLSLLPGQGYNVSILDSGATYLTVNTDGFGTATAAWTNLTSYSIDSSGDITLDGLDVIVKDLGTEWVRFDQSARSVDITGSLDVTTRIDTPAITIDGNGQTLIVTGNQGTGSAKAKITHGVARPNTVILDLVMTDATSQTGDSFLRFFDNAGSTQRGSITGDGGTGIDVNLTSDAAYKAGIREADIPSALAAIRAIRERDWDPSDPLHPRSKIGRGYIAQELYAVYPDAATPGYDLTVDDGEGTVTTERVPWSVAPMRLIPLLTRAVREQDAEVAALRDRVVALEARIDALKPIPTTR